MAINFTNLGGTPAPVEVTPTNGFSLNLEKNNFLNLTKAAPSMTKAKLAARWDISGMGAEADLDISVFLLNQNQKLSDASHVVFYNNKNSCGVSLDKDNRTGAGDGDDETISIDFSIVPSEVNKIVCCVTIHEAQSRRQTFGMVKNANIRILNANENDKEICTYSLSNEFSTDTAVVIGAFNRDGNTWNFQAMGEGYVADLNNLAVKFM